MHRHDPTGGVLELALWALSLVGSLLVAEDKGAVLDEGVFLRDVAVVLPTEQVVPRRSRHDVPRLRISQTVGAGVIQ